MFETVTNIDRAKGQSGKGGKVGFIDREVGIVINRSRGRPPKEMVEFMTRTNITMDYLRDIQGFVTRLKKEQKAGEVFIETGRRFDKIKVTFGKVEKLMFFVEKNTSRIYGVRSPVAPNFNHYFGTLATAKHWKWSGDRPEPKNEAKAGVERVGGYNQFTHYAPIGETEG